MLTYSTLKSLSFQCNRVELDFESLKIADTLARALTLDLAFRINSHKTSPDIVGKFNKKIASLHIRNYELLPQLETHYDKIVEGIVPEFFMCTSDVYRGIELFKDLLNSYTTLLKSGVVRVERDARYVE